MYKEEKFSNQKGLTLVEILVVIVLIGIMMTILVKNVSKSGAHAKAQLNVTQMQKVKNALAQYRLQYNTYPSKLEDLVKPSADLAKNSDGNIFTPLLEQEDLYDVWKTPYRYKTENNNRSFTLTSLGSDGIEGGEGADQDVTLRP